MAGEETNNFYYNYFIKIILSQVGSHLSVWFEEDGWMHVAVDGADLGPLLPHVTKVSVL